MKFRHIDCGLCSRTDDNASLHKRPRLRRVNCHTSTCRPGVTKVCVKPVIAGGRHVVQVDDSCQAQNILQILEMLRYSYRAIRLRTCTIESICFEIIFR